MGINLLREGSICPRSRWWRSSTRTRRVSCAPTGSLIQTIGRAARNVNGKAILYADRITDSIKMAIGETERRRAKQVAFNETHGIQPQTIRKAVADVMEGARAEGGRGVRRAVAEPRLAYEAMSPQEVAKRLARLEQAMHKHAQELEFEEAAKVRDEIADLRRFGLGLPDTMVG